MSTQNVPSLNISTVPVADANKPEDAEKQEKRLRSPRPQVISDSVRIAKANRQVSGAAEVLAPQALHKDGHEELKDARAKLAGVIATAEEKIGTKTGEKTQSGLNGGEITQEDIEPVLHGLEDAIDQSRQSRQGQDTRQVAVFENLRDQLRSAFESYQSVRTKTLVFAETASPNASVSSTSTGLQEKVPAPGETADAVLKGEEVAWSELKKIGIVKGASDQNSEKVQDKINLLKKQHLSLSKDVKSKEAEIKKLQGEFQTATSPETKTVLVEKIKALQGELNVLVQKRVQLQRVIALAETHLGNIERAAALRDIEPEAERVYHRRKVQAAERQERRGSLHSSSVSGHAEVVQAPGAEAGSGGLRTTSAGGGLASLSTTPSTVSTETAAAETPATAVGGLHTASTYDASGVTLSIASNLSAMRSEARRADKDLKKLLRDCLAGNWEAVKMAMIILDKRISISMVQIGAKAVKVQMDREKFTAGVADGIGKLTGNEANYGALLQKGSADLQQSSLMSQSVMNLLKDVMNLKMEITEMTGGIITKDGQIGLAAARQN